MVAELQSTPLSDRSAFCGEFLSGLIVGLVQPSFLATSSNSALDAARLVPLTLLDVALLEVDGALLLVDGAEEDVGAFDAELVESPDDPDEEGALLEPDEQAASATVESATAVRVMLRDGVMEPSGSGPRPIEVRKAIKRP
jgi:hypothetical protein